MASALKERAPEQEPILGWSRAAVSAQAPTVHDVAVHYAAAASRTVFTRKHLFDQLSLEWHEGTRPTSSLSEIQVYPSYQRIIGMGRDALPYIVDALRRQADHWHWALFAITGENPVPSGAEGNLELIRVAWLLWASRDSRATASRDAQLSEAAQFYLEGKVEISQLARMLSADPSDIAAEFEQRGFVRSLTTIQLSEEERRRRLLLLCRARAAGVMYSATLAARDVIASQRIEGIDARLHLASSDPVE